MRREIIDLFATSAVAILVVVTVEHANAALRGGSWEGAPVCGDRRSLPTFRDDSLSIRFTGKPHLLLQIARQNET